MDYTGVDSSENGSIEVEETVQGTRRLEGNQSKSKRAGLVMSVARIEKNLRKGNYANRIGTSGAVYTAGVLEYLCAEVLELAGEAAKQNKRIRIIPRHIMMAIANDEELKVLLKDVQIPDAGVMPFIHPVLMKPNTKANDGENVEQEI